MANYCQETTRFGKGFYLTIDVNWRRFYLEGMKDVLGAEYVDPREHVHFPGKNSGANLYL